MPRVDEDVARSTNLLHSRRSLAQAFSNALSIFEIWHERSERICLAIQAKNREANLR